MPNSLAPENRVTLETLFATATDPAKTFADFHDLFAPLADAERLAWRDALVTLLKQKLEGHADNLAEWLPVILAEGPVLGRAADGLRLLDGAQEPGSEALEDRLCQLLARHLSATPPAERGLLLETASEPLRDVSLAAALFRLLASASTEEAVSDRRDDYFGPRTEDLRAKLFARVQNLAKTGEIWSQASPAALLWFWWACGQEQKVYEFTQQAMRDKKSAASLFPVPVDRLLIEGAAHEVVLARRWSKILDLHGLERPALELALQGETREIRKSARRFLDAFANGKSDLYR